VVRITASTRGVGRVKEGSGYRGTGEIMSVRIEGERRTRGWYDAGVDLAPTKVNMSQRRGIGHVLAYEWGAWRADQG
jgi:hypothetical protein